MATFTALAKFYSSEYFCNARVAGIVQRKFLAIRYTQLPPPSPLPPSPPQPKKIDSDLTSKSTNYLPKVNTVDHFQSQVSINYELLVFPAFAINRFANIN